jgi:hypothetical protein
VRCVTACRARRRIARSPIGPPDRRIGPAVSPSGIAMTSQGTGYGRFARAVKAGKWLSGRDCRTGVGAPVVGGRVVAVRDVGCPRSAAVRARRTALVATVHGRPLAVATGARVGAGGTVGHAAQQAWRRGRGPADCSVQRRAVRNPRLSTESAAPRKRRVQSPNSRSASRNPRHLFGNGRELVGCATGLRPGAEDADDHLAPPAGGPLIADAADSRIRTRVRAGCAVP